MIKGRGGSYEQKDIQYDGNLYSGTALYGEYQFQNTTDPSKLY